MGATREVMMRFGLLAIIFAGSGGRSAEAGWVQLTKSAPWSARSDPQLAVLNNSLLVLGGHNNDTWFNDVWKTADGVSWTMVTGAAEWSPRAAAGFQVKGDWMLVMGGSNGLLKPIGNGTVFNDVWVSQDHGKRWKRLLQHAPWPAREGLQKLTALYNGTIVLTAGEAGYFGPYYNDVWGSEDGSSWTLFNQAAGFSKRSGNLLLNVNEDLYTFGGYGLPMKHDCYCLPKGGLGGKWHQLAKAPWHGRFDYDMVFFNNSIVLLAGEASLFGTGGPYFNDVWT